MRIRNKAMLQLLQVIGIVIFTLVAGISSAQDKAGIAQNVIPQGTPVSSQPYPVGDMRITRESVTTQSFILRFENLDLIGGHTNSARTQTYMLAGARGRVPTAHVIASEFVYVDDGRITSTTTTIPQQVRQGFIRVNDLGLMRQFWVYTLSLTSASPGGGTGSWVCKSAAILLDIGPPPAGTSAADMARFDTEESHDIITKAMLLNPDISPEYYNVSYNDPIDAWRSWNTRLSTAGNDIFKLKIYRGGFYKLSAADLIRATSGTITTPATKWRAYKNGTEIPLVSDPDSPDNIVYLPVAAKNKGGLWTEVYWLDTSGTSVGTNAPPLRYKTADSSAATWRPKTDVTQTTASFTIQHRELVDYNPRLKSDAANDRWVWADLSAGTPARLTLQMPDYYDPPRNAKVTATVRYGFANFPPVVPAVVMTLSNHYSAGTTLTAQMGQVQIELPASMLKPGANEIALQLQYPPEGINKRPVSIQYIETAWEQPLEIPANNSYFFKTAAATTAPLSFNKSLAPSASLFAFDKGVPQLLESNGKLAQSLAPGAQLLLANTDGATSVSDVTRGSNHLELDKLKATRAVIVAAPELIEPTQQLADLQRQRGFDVAVYNTEQLYDIFAFGNPSPSAIQNALRYLFVKAPGTPPEYVTLVGEASEFQGDPAAAPKGIQLEMVPASTADNPGAIQGDEGYAASIGTDMVADFVVGRIPAAKPEQVLAYVNKVRKYEAEPIGEWARRTDFVMDDNNEFPDVVNQIVSRTMSPVADNNLFRQWDYEYVPNQRVPGKKRSWQATAALIKNFNQGFGVLNFFGHGGPNLWSHERLFHLSDLPEVQNGGKLPLITCASCDNAWIAYPMPPVNESMGELLVLKPDGGAIGLFGPVSGASPYEHSTLVQSLMEALLRQQLRRTGDAIFYAKNMYYAITRSSSIAEQYLLLGDPTIKLKMPMVEPLLTPPDESPRVATDGPTRIGVRVKSDFTFLSSGTLSLYESGTNKLLGQQHVMPRQSLWMFELPADFDGGCVMALLDWEKDGQRRLAGTSIRVLPVQVNDNDNIKRDAIAGNSFDIRAANNANKSTTKLDSLFFEIKPLKQTPTTASVQVDVYSNGQEISPAQGVELAPGSDYVPVSIQLKDQNSISSGSVTVVVSQPESESTTATFSVVPPQVADIEFAPGSAKVYSLGDKLISGATVILEAQIRNVGNATANRVTLQARKDSATTGTELITINDSTTIQIDNLKPDETRTVKFRWEQSAAGDYDRIYLIANQSKATPENNQNNNTIAMPDFTVERLGNFSIGQFDVSPSYVIPGTPVMLSATLLNSNPRTTPHPVTVEIGWERAFDNATTFTRTPITLQNGVTTITEKLIAPKGYTHLYLTVNSDSDVEEANTGDNTKKTASMMSYELDSFDSSIKLDDSLNLGMSYNVTMPFDAQFQVVNNFTSTTMYIRPPLDDVKLGNAVVKDIPTDNAWQVIPWRIFAASTESPGPLEFNTAMPGNARDVPGQLRAYIPPYPSGKIPLEITTGDTKNWRKPVNRGQTENKERMDFGTVSMVDGKVSFAIRKASPDAVTVYYFDFVPHALQWDSVPYKMSSALRNKKLTFAMDTDKSQWQKVYVEWRSGQSLNNAIKWDTWHSSENTWQIPFEAAEFIQFRVIAAPKPGMQPFIQNFRITK